MATRPKVSIDREKIIKIKKEVFEEELKKQEVNITNIISSNFTLTLKEIKILMRRKMRRKKSPHLKSK